MAITGIRSDPLPAFNFFVSLIDTSSVLATIGTIASTANNFLVGGGFSECSGLESTMQVEEYAEGGENRYVHKFPTRMTHSNIMLKRGITPLAEDLWNWHMDYVNGNGKRRDGVIVLCDELRLPLKTWTFSRGLPLKWTGPTLNAAQSTIAIESLEIMHEGLRLWSVGTGISALGAEISARF
jgi:phage tail-like protein